MNPDAWRRAEHPEHGYVFIANRAPHHDGRIYCMFPGEQYGELKWCLCSPEELTYVDIDTHQGTDQ